MLLIILCVFFGWAGFAFWLLLWPIFYVLSREPAKKPKSIDWPEYKPNLAWYERFED